MHTDTQADIRLIVIDIDGTLLTPESTITTRTLQAVQAAQKTGIVVTLATARRYSNTAPIANELGLNSPLILYDGAILMQHPHPAILYKQLLPANVGQQAVDILIRHNIQPVVHPFQDTKEEVWTGPPEFDTPWVNTYFASAPVQIHRMPFEALCTGYPDPIRVVAFASEEIIHALLPEITALECSWSITKRGNYGSSELAIMHQSCSKASGVMKLARYFNVPLEEIMAIGDNNNDIEMLRTAGWGVAMGQASEAVKSAAQAITTSNKEDGVARAIERYALCEATTADSNSLKRLTCL